MIHKLIRESRGKTELATQCIVITAVVLLSLYSFAINIDKQVAGRAGDFSTSSPSTIRWGLNAIKAKEAWEVTRGSHEVVVAVIDSGIDQSLSDLHTHLWNNDDEVPNDGIDNDNNGYIDDVYGWDFREKNFLQKSSSSLYYHGTFVAGLITSNYNKFTGAGGVAPDVSIMDLRFLDSGGRFYTSDWQKLARAIDYAVENGADIINLSIYASITPPNLVHQAIKKAEAKGVFVVGIAGNNGADIGYFGCWDEVFTVGSINKSGNVSDFSNHGRAVELVAPGANVLSLMPSGRVATYSGTSFSAPHVAGSAALILSKNPGMGLSELKRRLRTSARDIGSPGRDEHSGFGIIDTRAALNSVPS